jgi:hypothetical protein
VGGKCRTSADTLQSIDIADLFVTKPAAPIGSSFQAEDRAQFREFSFDPDATTRYRDELTSENELSRKAIDRHCCHSRCTPLAVGEPAETKPPLQIPTRETCIPRPSAGTSIPAPGDQGCPHGVQLDGVLRPYVRTTDDRCCYGMRS